jgi:predicted HTH transcriptional regulator
VTDDDIRRLLALKSEGPNLEYKAGFDWNDSKNRDHKYELMRDLIALANTKDGGRIVFGVNDADFQFVGVSQVIFESIDPADVGSMLHDVAAPKVRFAIYRTNIDGKRVVVFDVAEFDETPIICEKAIPATDGSKRVILRRGAVYIRTGASSTEEIVAPDEMRSLIERAVRRKQDELLKAMTDILTGRPAVTTADAEAAYTLEIAAAEDFLRAQLEPS